MFLVRRCPACGSAGAAPCERCHRLLRPAELPAPPSALDRWWALLAYNDPARELIVALKYRNHRDAVPWLAQAMAGLVVGVPAAVTWAPTTADRIGQRGFDQAELLARRVARRLGVGAVHLLDRTDTSHQTGHGRSDRLAGPQVTARGRCRGPVLLVDDVITTGSTVCRSAEALRAAGARAVWALAAAYQPRRASERDMFDPRLSRRCHGSSDQRPPHRSAQEGAPIRG